MTEGFPKNPNAVEVKVSAELQHVADLLNAELERIAGVPYGFALFVFPLGAPGNGSYISNVAPDSVEKVVRVLHKRLKKRLPTTAVHRLKDTQ